MNFAKMSRILCLAVFAGLLAGCSSALFENAKTDELFRQIKDSNPEDLGFTSIEETYDVSGPSGMEKMKVQMKKGNLLSVSYEGKKSGRITYIYNNGKACRIDSVSGLTENLTGTKAAAALKFFYDANYRDPVKLASHITLRSKTPVLLDGDKDMPCYVFEIVPCREYQIAKAAIYVDTGKMLVRRLETERTDVKGDETVLVTNSYKKIEFKNDLAVPGIIESSFLGEQHTLKLTEFRVNMPMNDNLFAVPEFPIEQAEQKTDKK